MLALSSPRLPSPLHCSCPEWFYKHFASGSIPVLINHCESDPSKTQSSLELRDGRSERERLQRGWRKRESLQPQWKGEEVQGKRSESEREADAELKAGGEACFGQRRQATGIGENPMVIAFSLREGGWGRLMTTALSMRVSDRWRNSAKKCVCVQEKGWFPTPEVANACTSLACYVAQSGTLLHVHDCMRFKGKVEGGGGAHGGRFRLCIEKKQLSCLIYCLLYVDCLWFV